MALLFDPPKRFLSLKYQLILECQTAARITGNIPPHPPTLNGIPKCAQCTQMSLKYGELGTFNEIRRHLESSTFLREE